MRLSIILFCFSFLFADEPDWVRNQGKSSEYPDIWYLTGYGIGTADNGVTKEETEQNALDNARKNLIEKIRITIQSVTLSRTEEIGDKCSSFFSVAVQSTSNLEIQGLYALKYFDEEVSYAFVFVKRENIQNTYQHKVTSLSKEIEEKIKLAKAYEQQGKSTQALNEYVSCYPLAHQLEEAQSLLTFVKLSNSLIELEQAAEANEITVSQIRDAVTKLVHRPMNSVDDIAWYLAYVLKEEVEQQGSGTLTVRPVPLMYQDSRMGSSFSRYFNQVLEQKSAEVAKWSVRQEGASHVISGSYWEQNDKVKFIVTVRAVSGGAILAGAEVTVDAKVLASTGRSLKPENFSSALADQKVFARDELTGGGLSLEAWTNKETRGNLFVEKERLKVYVRVNMPSYIRFIYHMANGKRVLLMTEYYIDQTKVNLPYEIPQEFECAAPFGSEVLQIFARTDTFEPVRTEHVNGYNYLREGLKNFVAKTRGMKIVKPNTMQAEKRITITTMKE